MSIGVTVNAAQMLFLVALPLSVVMSTVSQFIGVYACAGHVDHRCEARLVAQGEVQTLRQRLARRDRAAVRESDAGDVGRRDAADLGSVGLRRCVNVPTVDQVTGPGFGLSPVTSTLTFVTPAGSDDRVERREVEGVERGSIRSSDR